MKREWADLKRSEDALGADLRPNGIAIFPLLPNPISAADFDSDVKYPMHADGWSQVMYPVGFLFPLGTEEEKILSILFP